MIVRAVLLSLISVVTPKIAAQDEEDQDLGMVRSPCLERRVHRKADDIGDVHHAADDIGPPAEDEHVPGDVGVVPVDDAQLRQAEEGGQQDRARAPQRHDFGADSMEVLRGPERQHGEKDDRRADLGNRDGAQLGQFVMQALHPAFDARLGLLLGYGQEKAGPCPPGDQALNHGQRQKGHQPVGIGNPGARLFEHLGGQEVGRRTGDEGAGRDVVVQQVLQDHVAAHVVAFLPPVAP